MKKYTVNYETFLRNGVEVKEGTIHLNGHYFRTISHPNNAKLEGYIENLMYMLLTLVEQDQLEKELSH